MATAINLVFPVVWHRLCCFHINENSRKHIRVLRAMEGFTKLFNKVFTDCDTEPEFDHFWRR